MGAERRHVNRKQLESLAVQDITTVKNYATLAKTGKIIDASKRGFLLLISRKDLVPKKLRQNLNLDVLMGQQLALFLPQMNLDLDGIIQRTRHRGNGVFEIGVKFSDDVPEYWRECLVDLLPTPGEF